MVQDHVQRGNSCIKAMEDFYIDRLGENEVDDKEKTTNKAQDEKEDEVDDFLDSEELDLFDDIADETNSKKNKLKTKDEVSLNNTYLIDSYKKIDQIGQNSYSNVDKLLEKSVIKKGFEKNLVVPREKSKRKLKLERKKIRESTKGKEWFNMPATELTEEIKTDFELLKMRSVLDRKHMYKKNDITHTPKYFQVGRVVEGPADFYNGRIPKSLRKKTMVEELLADAEFKKYQKKKFKEIMDENRRKKRTKKNLAKNKLQKNGKFKR